MNNRKAMAPVISTLLLIAFAVALGIVVMSWGKAAQIEEEEHASCDEISIDLVAISAEPRICYSEGKLKFTLENTGQAFINSLKISLISENIETFEIDKPLVSADIVNIEYDHDISSPPRKIKITPKIGVGEDAVYCPKNGVETEDIGECGGS